MITRAQCRAARGLIGWTQQDLASAARISKTAVINFERGLSDIKSDTLRQIRTAFEQKKVQFGEMDRVQRKEDSCSFLEGYDKFFPLLRESLKDAGGGMAGEIMISFLGEQEMLRRNPESFYEIARSWEKNETKVRYLLSEGEFLFLQPFADYRWVTEDVASCGMTSVAFGNKVIFKLWDSDNFTVVESSVAAESERRRFEEIWRRGKIPPVHVANNRDR